MTSIDILCQLLNEHGIEYHIDYDLDCIEWLNGNTVLSALPMENGNVAVQAINELTPEQAVEVTLGYEPNDKEMCALHDKLNMVLLRLERNVDNGNERIAAVADAHELLEDAATLSRGTCKLEQHGSLADQPSMVCWSCSECGFGWHHSTYDKQFSYCPNCGKKVKQ